METKRRDTNSTKITISLKADERAALKEQAEREGVAIGTLCARLVRLHIKQVTKVTPQRAARKAK